MPKTRPHRRPRQLDCTSTHVQVTSRRISMKRTLAALSLAAVLAVTAFGKPRRFRVNPRNAKPAATTTAARAAARADAPIAAATVSNTQTVRSGSLSRSWTLFVGRECLLRPHQQPPRPQLRQHPLHLPVQRPGPIHGQIRIHRRRPHELLARRPHRSFILQPHRLRRPPALFNIPLHPPLKAKLVRRVDINPQIVERQQLRIVKRKQPLHNQKRPRSHPLRAPRHARVRRKVVDRPLDRLALRKRRHVCRQQRTLNHRRVVEVLLDPLAVAACAPGRGNSCRDGNVSRPAHAPTRPPTSSCPSPSSRRSPAPPAETAIAALLPFRPQPRSCFRFHHRRNLRRQPLQQPRQPPLHLPARLGNLFVAQVRRAQPRRQVRHARDAQHLNPHVPRHNRLRHRGHAHQRRPQRAKRANLRRRLKARPRRRQVNAFVQRKPFFRAASFASARSRLEYASVMSKNRSPAPLRIANRGSFGPVSGFQPIC